MVDVQLWALDPWDGDWRPAAFLSEGRLVWRLPRRTNAPLRFGAGPFAFEIEIETADLHRGEYRSPKLGTIWAYGPQESVLPLLHAAEGVIVFFAELAALADGQAQAAHPVKHLC